MRLYEEAIAAYNAGLAIAPTDSGLKSGLEEVKRAKASTDNLAGGFVGGQGGLFPPEILTRLANHPKFGAKLRDPAFRAKFQMAQKNPTMMLQDPELMEAFSLIIGDEDNAGPQTSTPPPRPSPANNPPPPKSAPMETEPETNLSEEEKAEKAKKANAIAAKERGNALYKEKKFEEALAAYDEAIALDPNNILFVSNKAAVYIEMGETDRAIEICNGAIEHGRAHRASYEDLAKVYQRQASAALKKDDIQGAIEYYGKAQMEFFDKAIERKIKNLELEAKKKATQAYINPELGLAAKERGNTLFREGDFGGAVREYEEAVKRDPTNAPYRNNLAAALLKISDFNGAKNQVEKCLELDPKYVKAWAKKGDIEFLMKEYHKAMDSYRTGLNIEPNNELCRAGLTKTIAKVQDGNNEEGDVKERQAHAMADPEIQNILADPMIRQVLQDLEENPKYGQQALKDPGVAAKINKLIAAGILRVK